MPVNIVNWEGNYMVTDNSIIVFPLQIFNQIKTATTKLTDLTEKVYYLSL